MCELLERNPDYRALRRCLATLLAGKKQIPLYAETGILPGTGFFSELRRRITHTALPDAVDPDSLKDVLGQIFNRSADHEWIAQVPDEHWTRLVAALKFEEETNSTGLDRTLRQLLDAVQVISHRVSSLGLEPELLRNGRGPPISRALSLVAARFWWNVVSGESFNIRVHL